MYPIHAVAGGGFVANVLPMQYAAQQVGPTYDIKNHPTANGRKVKCYKQKGQHRELVLDTPIRLAGGKPPPSSSTAHTYGMGQPLRPPAPQPRHSQGQPRQQVAVKKRPAPSAPAEQQQPAKRQQTAAAHERHQLQSATQPGVPGASLSSCTTAAGRGGAGGMPQHKAQQRPHCPRDSSTAEKATASHGQIPSPGRKCLLAVRKSAAKVSVPTAPATMKATKQHLPQDKTLPGASLSALQRASEPSHGPKSNNGNHIVKRRPAAGPAPPGDQEQPPPAKRQQLSSQSNQQSNRQPGRPGVTGSTTHAGRGLLQCKSQQQRRPGKNNTADVQHSAPPAVPGQPPKNQTGPHKAATGTRPSQADSAATTVGKTTQKLTQGPQPTAERSRATGKGSTGQQVTGGEPGVTAAAAAAAIGARALPAAAKPQSKVAFGRSIQLQIPSTTGVRRPNIAATAAATARLNVSDDKDGGKQLHPGTRTGPLPQVETAGAGSKSQQQARQQGKPAWRSGNAAQYGQRAEKHLEQQQLLKPVAVAQVNRVKSKQPGTVHRVQAEQAEQLTEAGLTAASLQPAVHAQKPAKQPCSVMAGVRHIPQGVKMGASAAQEPAQQQQPHTDSNVSSRFAVQSPGGGSACTSPAPTLRATALELDTSSSRSSQRFIDLGPPGYKAFVACAPRRFAPVTSEQQCLQYQKQYEAQLAMYCSLQIIMAADARIMESARAKLQAASHGSQEQYAAAAAEVEHVTSQLEPLDRTYSQAVSVLTDEGTQMLDHIRQWLKMMGDDNGVRVCQTSEPF